jgi:hypothetical protein
VDNDLLSDPKIILIRKSQKYLFNSKLELSANSGHQYTSNAVGSLSYGQMSGSEGDAGSFHQGGFPEGPYMGQDKQLRIIYCR